MKGNTVTWGGPCVYAGRFCTYRLWRLPLGLIHGLGIREIRTQLANCRPRIRRWNSIERNTITVFLPGREGMDVGIRFRGPLRVPRIWDVRSLATLGKIRHTVGNRRRAIISFEFSISLRVTGFGVSGIVVHPNRGSNPLIKRRFWRKEIKLLIKVNQRPDKYSLGYCNAFYLER